MVSPFFFEATVYRSKVDERAHFEWMQRIPCVRDVRGQGRPVFLTIAEDEVTEDDLRALSALYRRYGGDAGQLGRLDGIMDA
ncbi:MAG: hypothetical protein AVDCRST_MAG44-149 [uncultured Sphingomonas sp.]|uniref:Uncharacterized protein n=1 Tax=uncultured Sphingomonas sp. TaxID=158754 RepID=A0A6J4S506_9SPHN|nr:MAG: hypothetical protein AVDCRST_MAG44-149 [uncultured Sphingomonas sp.]